MEKKDEERGEVRSVERGGKKGGRGWRAYGGKTDNLSYRGLDAGCGGVLQLPEALKIALTYLGV